jgi:hypothetical protein
MCLLRHIPLNDVNPPESSDLAAAALKACIQWYLHLTKRGKIDEEIQKQ